MKTLEIVFAKNRKTGNVRFSLTISLAKAVLLAALYAMLHVPHPSADAHVDAHAVRTTRQHASHRHCHCAHVSRLAQRRQP